MFDFSEYQSKFFDPTNKKVIGKMKEKYRGILMNQYVGLQSKMHSILSENTKESNAAEGVDIAIEVNEYKYILFKKKIKRREMKRT